MKNTPITVINKPHKVGSFTFDSTYFEQHNSDVEVTDQPIEFGAYIPDHAYVKPIVLTISAGVGDFALLPNPSFDDSSTSARSSSAYQQLLILKNSLQLIDVQTGLANYQNMLITGLNTVQDVKTPDMFNFVMTLQQILVISIQNVNVPAEFLQSGTTSDLAAPTINNGSVQSLPLSPAQTSKLLQYRNLLSKQLGF